MAQAEDPPDHLSAFERAVCYYTIPRVSNHVTLGLIAAYAVCVLEATGAMLLGVLYESEVWFYAGMWALVAIVVFGMGAFFVRAVLSHVRAQRVLMLAHRVPDPRGDVPEIPDPFAGHVLLRYPRHLIGNTFAITTDQGEIEYFVQRDEHAHVWRVRTPQDEEEWEARVMNTGGSFVLGGDTPAAVNIVRGDQVIGRIRRRLGLPDMKVVIEEEGRPTLSVMGRGVRLEGRLVGRVYYLRQYLYLDVEERVLGRGLLAHFVSYSGRE